MTKKETEQKNQGDKIFNVFLWLMIFVVYVFIVDFFWLNSLPTKVEFLFNAFSVIGIIVVIVIFLKQNRVKKLQVIRAIRAHLEILSIWAGKEGDPGFNAAGKGQQEWICKNSKNFAMPIPFFMPMFFENSELKFVNFLSFGEMLSDEISEDIANINQQVGNLNKTLEYIKDLWMSVAMEEKFAIKEKLDKLGKDYCGDVRGYLSDYRIAGLVLEIWLLLHFKLIGGPNNKGLFYWTNKMRGDLIEFEKSLSRGFWRNKGKKVN